MAYSYYALYAHNMHMNESRDERLSQIRQIIASQSVKNQEELAQLLTDAGYSCTQSSVSRDLHDLGVVKSDGKYTLKETEIMQRLGILSAVPAGPNLLVVKTSVGAAQLVGVQIDHLGLSQIIGTVAGDDTIFIATANQADQSIVAQAMGVSK